MENISRLHNLIVYQDGIWNKLTMRSHMLNFYLKMLKNVKIPGDKGFYVWCFIANKAGNFIG